MTTRQVPGLDDIRSIPPEPCPCGHGDLAAEIEQQRPLIARALQGDSSAFVALYNEHVDDVYRYLLAWTWDSALARDLTGQVFEDAITWLPAIIEGDGELGAWLIALARDAVGQHRGAAWSAPGQTQTQDPFEAIEQLDDAQREVVVLRLLLGHSITHTAHLAGYDTRVVQELQLSACAAIWQQLVGAPLDPPPHGRDDLRPRWFEHCLSGAAMDTDADPALSEVVAVADALRQGSPEQVPLPDDGFVAWLRGQLLNPVDPGAPEPPERERGRLGRALAAVRHQIARHPWVATIVAAGAIGLVIGVQMAGDTPTRSSCTGPQCQATTTTAAAADQGSLPSLPVVGGAGEESTTTRAGAVARSSTSRPSTTRSTSGSSTTAPPTTTPPTTRTTRAPTTTTRRPTTTTRKPTTTTQQETTTSTTPPPGP